MGNTHTEYRTIYQTSDAQKRETEQLKQQLESEKNRLNIEKNKNANINNELNNINQQNQAQTRQVQDFSKELSNNYEEMLKKISVMPIPPDDNIVKEKGSRRAVCTIGPSSSGKSSIHNVIAGRTVCQVGLNDTTSQIKSSFSLGNTIFYDCPGSSNIVKYHTISFCKFLKSIDFCMIVYENSIKSVYDIIQLCESLKVKYVVVRNMADNIDTTEEVPQHVLSTEERDARRELKISFQCCKGFFLVSAKNILKGFGDRFQWDQLIKTIQ